MRPGRAASPPYPINDPGYLVRLKTGRYLASLHRPHAARYLGRRPQRMRIVETRSRSMEDLGREPTAGSNGGRIAASSDHSVSQFFLSILRYNYGRGKLHVGHADFLCLFCAPTPPCSLL